MKAILLHVPCISRACKSCHHELGIRMQSWKEFEDLAIKGGLSGKLRLPSDKSNAKVSVIANSAHRDDLKFTKRDIFFFSDIFLTSDPGFY